MSFLLEDWLKNPGKYEDEDDMWNWMIKQYSKYGNPSGASDRIYAFLQTQAIPLFQKFYNNVIPQLNTLKDIFQVPTNSTQPSTQSPTQSPTQTQQVQTGGSSMQSDCQYPAFFEYRKSSCEKLLVFLQKHHIHIQPITKKVLEHLYLCSYSIDYIKTLTYMLFILDQIQDIPEDKKTQIQNIFDKLSSDIQRSLLN